MSPEYAALAQQVRNVVDDMEASAGRLGTSGQLVEGSCTSAGVFVIKALWTRILGLLPPDRPAPPSPADPKAKGRGKLRAVPAQGAKK